MAASCMGGRPGNEASVLLADARAALEDVRSFRMETEFAAPLEGSGQLTSVTVAWASPETILTLARGDGDPGFQQVYQKGETCLARYSEDGEWEPVESGCAEPGQIKPTFRAWLEVKDPEIVATREGVVVVRGKALDMSEDEPPLVAYWELEIDTATSLVRRASGYAETGSTALIDTTLMDYNQPFDVVFSGLDLPGEV